MALKSLAIAAVLLCGALLGGCQNTLIGTGVPDPQLSARDKEMMALAPPDEARIPIARYQISESQPSRS